MRIAVCFVLALTVPGCSLVFVDRPRVAHPDVFPDCTDSTALPWVDAGIASTAATVSLFPQNDKEAAGSLVYMATFGLSALIGFRRVRACKEARQRWVDAHRQPPPVNWAPPSLTPPSASEVP